MIVQRAQDADPSIVKLAIAALSNEVKSGSASISSIPKGIKFLRTHYNTLKEIWGRLEGENQVLLADVISVLAMSIGESSENDSLKFRLVGTKDSLETWGHEYIRNLSHEIIAEYGHRQADDKPVDDLMDLVKQIIPFNISHNAEPAACDLLLEVERLADLTQFVDETNYDRICLYLLGNAKYSAEPEDAMIYRIILDIYKKMNKIPEALTIALQLGDNAEIESLFNQAENVNVQRQLAFLIGRQNAFDLENLPNDGEELSNLIGNTKLSSYYASLAKSLEVEEPKTPEDIYKTHLIDNRHAASHLQAAESAKQNLAASFVNAFVNAGFGSEKIINTNWFNKHKDTGKISAVASLGLVYLWNSDDGIQELDKHSYSDDSNIKAGYLLGIGVNNAGIRSEMDHALSLLSEYVTDDHPSNLKISSILGLGIAYAGTARADLNELLSPLVDSGDNIELASFTALALGLCNVGTANAEITEQIINLLMEHEADLSKSSFYRYAVLGLGLLFLGKQSAVDVPLEIIKTMDDKSQIKKYALFTAQSCAYAGTGNVIEIQKLLHACSEHLDEESAFQSVCVIGIAAIAIGEELGQEMVIRMVDHLLQYGDATVKRAVPLALGLISVSNPRVPVMDTLSKLSHDSDAAIAQSAILALGLIGAGTNNSRIATLLRQLSAYNSKDSANLFVVRIAQGLLHLGKGLVTLNPYHIHGSLLSKVSLAGLLVVLHTALDFPNFIHGNYTHMLFTIALAIKPRMLMTFDQDLNPLPVNVRVGQAVDVVGQAGKPKTITGFQTHTTPVLLAAGERAELATDDYISVSPYLEGCVVLIPNPSKRD
eukprot:TRINITY_DN5432_c0_g1_i1.p1 TRINITY_DN5432_c0_g1~~TRINITY_DN5432_c0_g1_i1.p1  ORF type:complete len:872 (+),score=501.26 TRINITY_DN5432_c0_g1_i1:135-2618(+)